MALHAAISLAGLQADIATLKKSYEVISKQNELLRLMYEEHGRDPFLPDHLQLELRKKAFLKGVDSSLFETLLLVGAIGAFQRFIKTLAGDVLSTYRFKHSRFSKIDKVIRDKYLSATATTFSYKTAGTVNGVRVNFAAIEKSLIDCLNDEDAYRLEGDALTSTMGNPNPTVITGVFASLGLKSPFDNHFGKFLVDNKWGVGLSNGGACDKAQSFLQENIGRRNDASHGLLRIVFDPGEILQTLDKIDLIAQAIFERANSQM